VKDTREFVAWNVGTPLAGILVGNVETSLADILVDGKKDMGIGEKDGGKPRPYQIPQPQKINLAPNSDRAIIMNTLSAMTLN
jgi:hypothetical protein